MRNLQNIINEFELDLMNRESDTISELCKFKVTDFIIDNELEVCYCLHYNKYENSFSIVKELFKSNYGDWMDTIFLETYSIESYDSKTLLSNINKYINS